MDQILFKNKLLELATNGKRYVDIYILPREQEFPVNVFSFGIDYCQKPYRNVRVNSHVTVLAYVLRGQGTIRAGGEAYVCKPGDVFILRKGTMHEVIVDDSAMEFTYFWYNLGGNSLSLLDSFRVPFPLHIADANIESLFRKGVLITGQDKLLSVQIAAMLVCTEILMTLNKLIIQRNSHLSNQVLKFMTYLDNTGFAAFHSKHMSQFFNMSVRHINRIFKSETGSSLYQYVLMRKSESAKMLLKDTSIPVREIAEKLGFTDQYHFSNFFKKRTGASPMEFRKQEN